MRKNGFTLIELMVSVAIMGILVGIAYPSYIDYVQKSRRAEGMRMLVEVASKQEQYFLDFKTYTKDMTQLGYSTDPFVTDSGYYSIDVVTADANIGSAFKLTATAKSTQAEDTDCKEMSLDHVGRQTATTTKCWVQ